MIQIQLNGESKELADGTTLAQLLEILALEVKYVAVERNLEVVPRAEHPVTQLVTGDRLEVVSLVGGG